MIEVIYKAIPKLLFEPIAITALLGLSVAAIMYWKCRERFFWILTTALLFMIFWRVVIVISTGRYASILIYPGILATAFFCFQAEWLSKYIPKFPDQWRKFVPWFLVIGLGIASIAKTLRFNPYSDHIIKASHCIAEDAAEYETPLALVIHEENRRIHYYSGIKTHFFLNDSDDTAKTTQHLATMINRYSIEADILYIVSFEQIKIPAGYLFRELPEVIRKNIILIGEYPQNRKMKRATRVYRYKSSDVFNASLNASASDNEKEKSVWSFDFSKCRTASEKYYSNMKDYYRKRKSLQCPEIKDLPLGWNAHWSAGYESGCNAKLGLIKYTDTENVFYLKSDKRITVYSSVKIPAKKYQTKMIVQGKPGTKFGLSFYCYSSKKVRLIEMAHTVLPTDGIYEYNTTIPDGIIPSDIVQMRPTISLISGELKVHRIDLY